MTSARSLIVLAALAGWSGAALAADKPARADDDVMVRVCDAFGEGYRLVPGTTTCVKIGGYVSAGVSIGSGPQEPPRQPRH